MWYDRYKTDKQLWVANEIKWVWHESMYKTKNDENEQCKRKIKLRKN